jgi:hypothetical protein
MDNPFLPLSPSQHRTQGWSRSADCRFAAADTVAPLLLGELAVALPHFMLAFVRQADGKPQLVAVTGLEAKQNLMVDGQGRWIAPYMPACYRTYPFSLQRLANDPQRLALCFNTRSGLLRQAPDASRQESRFFDDAGALVPPLQKLLEVLNAQAANAIQTQAAAAALDAAGLIQPWPALNGLFRVDEAALQALGAEQLVTLRDANALPLAYAQLLSQPRMTLLQTLLNKRREEQKAAQAAAPDLNLAAKLFEPGQPDTLKFNW